MPRLSDVTIRPARPDEADLVTGIALRSKAYWGYDEAFIETFRPELTVTAAQIASDHIVLAEREGRAAGFLHLRPESERTLELVPLFIDTWTIRQGVGQLLWNYAMAYAPERGYREVALEADPNAEPFYARQGAVITGQRESALMPGRVLNLMTFTLDGDLPGRSRHDDPDIP